ncbi:MAG: c-type cytochrome domain-containing protein, partial [Pirellulales bacterium]
MTRLSTFLGTMVCVAAWAWAVPTLAVDAAAFREQVAPLLAAKCGGCHGPSGAESGFRIDVREQALAGGDSGEKGIIPGKPAESEIYERITTSDKETVMPAEGEPLSAAEQA